MPRTRTRGVGPILVTTLLLLAACGGGSAPAAMPPFVVEFPANDPGGGGPPPAIPPPVPPQAPVFDADAFVHDRTVLFGSFPSDVVLHGSTLFTTDADEVDANGALVVPLDASGPAPVPSQAFVPVGIAASDLRDSNGDPADLSAPIGFGFFLNDLRIVGDHLGFVLANAGGSDSAPALSNLLAFDPTTGELLQVVNLASHYVFSGSLLDATGAPIPGGAFLQAGAEALEFVSLGSGRGRLYVAMTNFTLASSGLNRFPGTVQVFDVDLSSGSPVSERPVGRLATETLLLGGYNPVAIQHVTPDSPTTPSRLLVTVAGANMYDANFNLVPATEASVEVYRGDTAAYLGRFLLGLTGLSATRPALGYDAAGHHVGYFPSAVTGEVYLLLLDGLYTPAVDTSRLAVLRGPHNGIPITAAQSGGPGGNITGAGLAPDGRTLVVAGFGDLFALPVALPGQLFLVNLPEDVVTGAGFGTNFVPGSTLYGTVPGRALGALALSPNGGQRPDVYLAVSGPLDPVSFLGTGPGSVGTLQTFGLLR